jgi:riboflavin kinase/FMN adenylyltransferase
VRIVDGREALRILARSNRQDPSNLDAASATLVGVFDGVHLGHLRLLHELIQLGSAVGALPTVVTFRNHPDELLRGRDVEWIVSLPHRLRLLRRAGVGRVVLLDFDRPLQMQSAVEFTAEVLVDGLATKALLLGYDAAIGRDREGDLDRMQELGAQFGFLVRQGSRVTVDGQPISSTAIRAAIQSGDLRQCHRMLGRWPQAFGEVVHGDGRGRTLGFPTANLIPDSRILPPDGVYAVEVLLDGDTHEGVANLGARPTFGAAAEERRLEVHLLDFAGDLYGMTLELSFLARLRDQRRFADLGALSTQIADDVANARRFFAR